MKDIDVERVMREHEQQMRGHHAMTRWAHFTNVVLGVWLLTSPFTLGYLSPDTFGPDVARVTAERGLPPPLLRNTVMAWSDAISGLLVIVFGLLSLSRRFGWAQWANVAVGIWLLFAPLIFWTPSPAAYANDTLVGTLIIAFAILIPTMPGMSMKGMALGPDIPPGWTYSPSAWSQRIPIIAFAFVGFFIARYLAAYQLGHIPAAWDPFFGAGTMVIITSYVSQAWPVADAGLGASAYLLEALSGAMGSKRRWRTMPWMVAMFVVLVVPLGGVSIFFIVIQPILIGTWCTLCLVAAAAMVVMIPYSLDELVPMGQFLAQARREGRPFWRTFFKGGTIEGGKADPSSELDQPAGRLLRDMAFGGVNYPWNLVLCVALGAWLMFTRLIFGTDGAMANSDHLVGAMIITFTFAAMAEVARPVRFVNVVFGAWLIAAPQVLDGATTAAAWGSALVGIALIVLSLPRGPVRQQYGGWNRWIV